MAPKVSGTTIIGIAMASALVPLNSTMVAVALPKLARAFAIGRGRAGLLITVYLVAMLIGQPIAGRVCDALGNKRVAMTSLMGFAGCSVGAALAPTFAWLVTWRGVQALFAAALAPSVQSMLRSVTSPSERGHAFGINGSIVGVGAASGPIIGGALVSAFGWKAIFVANVPVAVTVLAVLATVKVRRVDEADNVASLKTADTGVAGVAGSTRPGDLLHPTFIAAFMTQALANLGQYSLLLVAPIVLDHRNWNSRNTGFALSALTVGLIVMGPLGGRFSYKLGTRSAIIRGLSGAALGAFLLVPFGITVPPALLIAALAVFGLGLGFASPSITTAGLEAVPPRRTGVAAGMLSASRYTGSIVASVMLSTFVADNGSGGRIMYIAAGVAMVLAVAVSSRLPSRDDDLTAHRPVAT